MAIVANNLRLARENPELAEQVKLHFDELISISEQWDEGSFAIPQGYTYLGQFLAHDLAGREFVNHRSPRLDLDSVYPEFEDAALIDPSSGKFLYKSSDDSYLADFLRDPDTNKALIPEFRNDDHFVLAQLHLHLLFFHNGLIELLVKKEPSLSPREHFQIARQYLCACLQKIILEEYLPTVCDKDVYEALWCNARPCVIDIPDSEVTLPYEITHAAGRYGHSQVRSKYILNTLQGLKKELTLTELFAHSGHNPAYMGAPHDMAVDWSLFFYHSPRELRELSQRINPFVNVELRQHPNPDIVKMNLFAGAGKALASGQEMAELVMAELVRQGIGDDPSMPLGVTPELGISRANKRLRGELEKIGLWNPMPLWLFVLIEADSNANGGLRLGPLGSVLLIETVKNATKVNGEWNYADSQTNLQDKYDLPPVRNMYELLMHAQPLTAN